MVVMLEPVIDRQISNIFADKKISTKLKKELLKGTDDFTPEKRDFYKLENLWADANIKYIEQSA